MVVATYGDILCVFYNPFTTVFLLVLESNVSVTLVNLMSHGLAFNEPLIPASALWCKVLLH